MNLESMRRKALVAETERLRQGEERFRVLFEKSVHPVFLVDGIVYIDCNEAALRLFGCTSKEQLLGLHPLDLSPERQPDGRLSSEKLEELNRTTYRDATLVAMPG